MVSFNRPSDQDQFGRYWDALVRGADPAELARLAEPLDPDVVALAAQWRALRQERSPRPAFTQKLERELMEAFPLTLPGASPLRTPLPQPPNGLAPPHRPMPALFPQRGRWALAQAAIALFVVLAIVAAYFTFNQRNDRAGAPAFATPPADATPAADWPMYRGNPGRTGEMFGPGPDGEPVVLWQFKAVGPAWRSPAIAAGVAYLQSSDGSVYALDALTGQERWRNSSTGTVENTPAVANDTVYLTNATGQLVALSAATGQERWRFAEAISPECTPVVVDGVVYVGSEDGEVFAIDAADGSERWRAMMSGGILRSLAVGGDLVFTGTTNGHVHAVEIASGKERWQFAAAEEEVIGTPTVANGVVYANQAGTLYALDAASGSELWTKAYAGARPISSAGDMLISGGLDGTVYAIDAATGDDRWTFMTGDSIQAAPAVVGNTVYVASLDRSLYALDVATGEERWAFEADGVSDYGPSVANGIIYLSTDAGTLYALGGSGMQQLAAPESATSTPPAATPVAATSSTTTLMPAEVTAPTLVHLWTRSTGQGDLSGALAGFALDPFGRIWVCNQADGSLILFDRDGNELSRFVGGIGSEPGQWNWVFGTPGGSGPHWLGCGIAFAPDGTAYVTDLANKRVQILAPDGSLQGSWTTHDAQTPDLQGPVAITRLANGELLVVDFATVDVARRFSADGTLLGQLEVDDDAIESVFDPIKTLQDKDGNVWVTEITEQRVVKLAPYGALLLAIGGPQAGPGPGEFSEPTGMALDEQGNIYVADDDNRRIQLFNADGEFLAEFTGEQAGIPRFGAEGGGIGDIAYGGGGNLYVLDYGNDKVGDGDERLMKFRVLLPALNEAAATPVASAEPAERVWRMESDPALPISTVALAPDGTIWAPTPDRILRFSPNGEVLEPWGEFGEGVGQINTPTDIAFATDGGFYLADSKNRRVQQFDKGAAFVRAWGSFGQEDGQFLEPYGVAIAPSGDVYVSDSRRGDIQVFSSDGAFKFKFASRGTGEGQLESSACLNFDRDGNLWAVDWGNHRLLVFSPDGTLLRAIGSQGSGEGEFLWPQDIAFDAAGRIYVTDGNNGRVVVLDRNGEWLTSWTGAEDGDPAFGGEVGTSAVVGLALDNAGNIYTSDFTPDFEAVQKFRLLPPLAP